MNRCEPIARPIDLWNDFHWFAVQTKARRESFAAANIGMLGVGFLLPQIKVDRLVRGAAQVAVKPLFPGYLFARFCPEKSLESIECTQGVLKVLSSGRFPLPVADEVVDEIHDRVEEDGVIRLRPQILAPGTRVSIQTGPFEGMIGRVERELDDGKRVAILLETLLNARVLIERRWLGEEAP